MSPLIEFGRLRIPLHEIRSATNNFAGEHIIGRGGFGNVYKGQLLHHGQLIDVAIKRLDRKFGQGDKEFWTDIAMRSSLNHENLVSLVGFCDEANEKIIINEYQVNGSLDKYLSSPTLTWLQRLHICIGVARALCYIHYDTGRGYDVIHRNIKSSKVTIDGNWDAKVSGFGLAINNSATRRNRLVLDPVVGTMGYIDPVYMETGTVTHKSDVYSFGVVLFEVLSGRRAFIKDATGKIQSQAPMATSLYEEGKLGEIIDPYLRNQMHPQSFKIFSDTAYHCLNKQRAQRPDMVTVVKRLEKAWELQRKHENPAPLKHASIITLAGENNGASMHLASDNSIKPDSKNGDHNNQESTKAILNSNAQGINNSMMCNSSATERSPGVHLRISRDLAYVNDSDMSDTDSMEMQRAEVNLIPPQKLVYNPAFGIDDDLEISVITGNEIEVL